MYVNEMPLLRQAKTYKARQRALEFIELMPLMSRKQRQRGEVMLKAVSDAEAKHRNRGKALLRAAERQQAFITAMRKLGR